MDLLIAISGAQLLTLLGIVAKIWSWSTKLEGRLARLETQVTTLLNRDEARIHYLERKSGEVIGSVQIP